MQRPLTKSKAEQTTREGKEALTMVALVGLLPQQAQGMELQQPLLAQLSMRTSAQLSMNKSATPSQTISAQLSISKHAALFRIECVKLPSPRSARVTTRGSVQPSQTPLMNRNAPHQVNRSVQLSQNPPAEQLMTKSAPHSMIENVQHFTHLNVEQKLSKNATLSQTQSQNNSAPKPVNRNVLLSTSNNVLQVVHKIVKQSRTGNVQ